MGELGIGDAHAPIETVASLRGFWFVAALQIENRAFVNTTPVRILRRIKTIHSNGMFDGSQRPIDLLLIRTISNIDTQSECSGSHNKIASVCKTNANILEKESINPRRMMAKWDFNR